jgi:hypothetical protein
MIRLELKGGGTGYFYTLEMSKRVVLFNCHETENKINQTFCVNDILSSHLKCQLPWDQISNSSLEVCSGKERVKELYNATVSMAESSAMDTEINNRCFLVPNCETRSWFPTDGNFVKTSIDKNETQITFYTAAGSKV